MTLRRARGHRLFVTGGSGFLGRHVLNGPATEHWDLIAPSSASLDLRYRESVRSVIHDWKPTAIIHTAYRTGDRASIVDASGHLAEAAHRGGIRFVHVSTDAVFAGRPTPYTEFDAPTPINDYGRDKADAERLVLDACPGAVVVRTSLLYGRREMSVHELAVRDAISGHSDIRFFTDEIRCPVLVDDLAAVLTDLAHDRSITGILHVGGPEALSRADLAVLTAQRHGWDAGKLRYATIADSGLVRPARIELDSSLARSHGIAVRGPSDWDSSD